MKAENIRPIYEGCYGIAEIVNDSEFTSDLGWKIHILLGNMAAGNISQLSTEESKGLTLMIRRLDREYMTKFEELEEKQKRLQEATA
jgi:protein-disulfide isomerase-like protein with CxxC motif